jgi:hypothetical protein
VHAENLSGVVERERLTEIDIAYSGIICGDHVRATCSERVVIDINNFRAEVILQVHLNKTLVLRVSDTTTVVGLRHHIAKRVIWDLLVLVQEEQELLFRDTQITHGERVRDVPSKRAELSTLENQGIEEAKPVEESLESLWLVAVVELRISDTVPV